MTESRPIARRLSKPELFSGAPVQAVESDLTKFRKLLAGIDHVEDLPQFPVPRATPPWSFPPPCRTRTPVLSA
ncbi:MAG: hypothetical protein KDN05_11500 [Verrucomicrobiae bacterium]|nr:hypothetical protein [Verrucomicrobiae bacterium]